MEKMGEEAAAKFINALIKSVQTLCHGYLDFQTGIEIIGHINLSVDKENSLDYILKEKVCKNAENSTLFISHSFHAEPKSEQEVPGKNAQPQAGNQNVQSTDSGESGRVSSAISSISSALSGSRERSRQSNAKDSGSPHSYQSTAKRKASDDSGSEVRPPKVSSHHDSISRTSSDSAFPPTSSSPVDSKQSLRHLRTSDDNMSQTMLPQTANFTSDNAADIGVNLAGSVLEPVDDQSNPDLPERDDESDGDLEVTFIKEEYMEGERSACEFENSGQQFVGGPHRRASEGMPDPSLYPVALHGSSASATYVPSAHDQQFQPGSLGPSTSQPQPGPSGMRGNVCQQQAAQPLPPGARPGCGYVHPADAQKWMVQGPGTRLEPGAQKTEPKRERIPLLSDEEYGIVMEILGTPTALSSLPFHDPSRKCYLKYHRMILRNGLNLMEKEDPYRGGDVERVVKEGRIVLPESEIDPCIEFYQRTTNDGIFKLVERMREHYYGISKHSVQRKISRSHSSESQEKGF